MSAFNSWTLAGRFERGLSSLFKEVFPGMPSMMRSLLAQITGSEMTGAQSESMDYQAKVNNMLAEQDYDRKLDFYEKNESPAAQVRQYNAAGLNPALMYQSGASVSASGGVGVSGVGAPSSFGGVMELMSMLMGFKQRQMQMDNELKIAQMQKDVQDEKNRIQSSYVDIVGSSVESQNSLREQQRFMNAVRFPLEQDQLKKNLELADSALHNDTVRRALDQSQINLNNWTAKRTIYEVAWTKVMAEKADEMMDIQVELNAALQQKAVYETYNLGIEGRFLGKSLQAKIDSLNAQVEKILVDAAYTDKRVKNYTYDMVLDGIRTVGSIVTAGAAVFGATAIGKGSQAVESVISKPSYVPIKVDLNPYGNGPLPPLHM